MLRLGVRGVSGSITHKGCVSQFFTVTGMKGQVCGFNASRILCPLLCDMGRIDDQQSFYQTYPYHVSTSIVNAMIKTAGFFFILLLIPGLSFPSIIFKDHSRETVTPEVLTAGVGASGAIDATASHVFANTGPDVGADTRISVEKQSDENQLSLPQKSAAHPAHREIPSFYLLVIVMIFALFIELTGNRYR